MHSISSNYNKIQEIYLKATKGLNASKLETPETLEWYQYIKNLSEPLKTVYLVTVLENQVINGGFDQFFSNLYGQFSHMTILALQKIKANEKSEILSKALRIYNPHNLSEDEFVVWLTKRNWLKEINLENLLQRTEKVDKSYWNSNEDILLLLHQYITEASMK